VPRRWPADAAAFVVPASPLYQVSSIATAARSPLEDLACCVQHVEGTGAMEVAADGLGVEGALVVTVQGFGVPLIAPGEGK
jgi:hypothetical protein